MPLASWLLQEIRRFAEPWHCLFHLKLPPCQGLCNWISKCGSQLLPAAQISYALMSKCCFGGLTSGFVKSSRPAEDSSVRSTSKHVSWCTVLNCIPPDDRTTHWALDTEVFANTLFHATISFRIPSVSCRCENVNRTVHLASLAVALFRPGNLTPADASQVRKHPKSTTRGARKTPSP